MASSPPVSRRLDFDIRTTWRQVISAVRGAQRWPLFKWLTPDVPVRVLRADGSEAVWLGEAASTGKAGARRAGAFVAVELREDIVLRRRLLVPAMQDTDVASAAELDAKGATPFPLADLVWGFCRRQSKSGAVDVEIAMASRKQVEQHLAETAPALGKLGPPEVWAISSHGAPIVFAGFGESRRTSNAASWRRLGYGLLLTAAILLAAMALTPVAQLRMRSIEATVAFQSLQSQSASVVQQRESLVKTSAKLNTLSALLADTIDPLAAMDFLTRVLPDDTALLSLQMQGQKVNISGHTNDAAALMQNLSKQVGLRDVKAPGVAMRPPGATKDSFNIEFMLDPKVYETPAAAASDSAASEGDVARQSAAPSSSTPSPAPVVAPSPLPSANSAQPVPPAAAAIAPAPPTTPAAPAAPRAGGGGPSLGGRATISSAPAAPAGQQDTAR
jgi:general secretion pathway protein L